MSRALVTLAVGPHVELLEIARPSFDAFADRHSYEVVVADVASDRPASWRKVPALLAALDEFEEALWVDADVVIVDPSEDVPVGADSWQAVVEHQTADGAVPNLGVWYVRQPMREVLQQVWSMTGYRNHPWWEQAAMCELLGYRGVPLHRATASELCERTTFLPFEWNCHRNDFRYPTNEVTRFAHATMFPNRAGVMRDWAAAVDREKAAA